MFWHTNMNYRSTDNIKLIMKQVGQTMFNISSTYFYLQGNIVVYLFFDTFSCLFPALHGCSSPLGIACINVSLFIINGLPFKKSFFYQSDLQII